MLMRPVANLCVCNWPTVLKDSTVVVLKPINIKPGDIHNDLPADRALAPRLHRMRPGYVPYGSLIVF